MSHSPNAPSPDTAPAVSFAPPEIGLFSGNLDELLDILDATQGDRAGFGVSLSRSVGVPWGRTERERRRTPAEDLLMEERVLVAVVDDSDSVRESLPDLLQEFGFAAQVFASAEAFLASDAAEHTSCLILDVGLPGMSGPDLQQELIRRGIAIPIVFITAQGDASLRPRLLARGAAAFLLKPFSDDALLEAVNTALGKREI